MTTFRYEGVTREGLPIQGELKGASASEVVDVGKAKGETYYTVCEMPSHEGRRRESKPLSADDLNLFTTQLASLIRSGVPLAPALSELSQDLGRGRLCRVLEGLAADVAGGQSLEDALRATGEAVPPLYVSLVRVGERTGNLPAVLQQLSQFGQRYLWLRYRLQVAMAYPLVLASVLLIFLGLFVPHIMVQFGEIYDSFGVELPVLSVFVWKVGGWVLPLGLPLLASFAVVLLTLRLLRLRGYFRHPIDRLALALPYLGPVVYSVAAARFFRALSLLLAHGAPIVESLHLASLASGNAIFELHITQAAGRIAQGEGVSDALRDTGLLRRSHAWMLQQGERNGTFTESIASLAETCDAEAQRLEEHGLALLGPAAVTVCGVLVGAAVIASFLPVFQLTGIMR